MEESIMCGKGWDKLINPLRKAAEATGAEVLQVKEKFGGLRFYVYNAPDWFQDIIHQMENFSYHVCESCGKPGEVREDGWIKTLCTECHEQR